MWLCFLSEHSLLPGDRNLSLKKLAFFFPASNSRSAKGKLFFINSVPQNNLRLQLWKFIPRGPTCPMSSLNFSFNSHHSEAKAQFFIFSGTENAGRCSNRSLRQHQSGLSTAVFSNHVTCRQRALGLRRAWIGFKDQDSLSNWPPLPVAGSLWASRGWVSLLHVRSFKFSFPTGCRRVSHISILFASVYMGFHIFSCPHVK